MSGVDEFLAQYYNTNGAADAAAEEEIEKTAQLTLLAQDAEAAELDLSQFSEDELVKIAAEVYGGSGESTEDGQEKLAEDVENADFCGRVMAHSFYQELGNIQKEAGIGEAIKGVAGRASGAIRGAAGKAGGAIKGVAGKAGEGAENILARIGKGTLSAEQKQILSAGSRGDAALRAAALKRGKQIVGGTAAGLGVAGTGAGIYAATRKKKKGSDSAFEELINRRALEHLAAAGYIDDEGNVYEPEKTASDWETTVDAAALQRLESLGYPVEWRQ